MENNFVRPWDFMAKKSFNWKILGFISWASAMLFFLLAPYLIPLSALDNLPRIIP